MMTIVSILCFLCEKFFNFHLLLCCASAALPPSPPILAIKRNGKSKTKQSEYEGEALLLVGGGGFLGRIFNLVLFHIHILEKIRVGRDYQAICPPLIPDPERKPETLADRALLVWSPTKEIADKSCKYRCD